MMTRAAFAWGPNQPLEVKEIDLEWPKDGEVLVQIVTRYGCSERCASHELVRSGRSGLGFFRFAHAAFNHACRVLFAAM